MVNDPSADGVGFCCYEVRVNGLLTADAVNSHAFESRFGRPGADRSAKVLSVRLKHRSGCVPRVLESQRSSSPFSGLSAGRFRSRPRAVKCRGRPQTSTAACPSCSSSSSGASGWTCRAPRWPRRHRRSRLYVYGPSSPLQGENLLRLTHLAPDGTLEVKGEARFQGDVPEA